MNNIEGSQAFSIGLDINELRQNANAAIELLNKIGATAVEQGNVFDKGLSSMASGNAIANMSAALEGLQKNVISLGSTPLEMFSTLSHQISIKESEVAGYASELENLKEKTKEAFNAGDAATVEALSKEISVLSTRISVATDDATTFRNALEAVKAMVGISGATADTPMFFRVDKDLWHVEQLKEKISELQSKIKDACNPDVNGQNSPIDTKGLTDELIKAQAELTKMQSKARAAANVLGSELGAKAEVAQQSVLSLNKAIKEQDAVITEIKTRLAEATEEYKNLVADTTNSSESVEKAGAVLIQLNQALSEAENGQTSLINALKEAQQELDKANESYDRHTSLLTKWLGGTENVNKMLEALPAPLKNVVSGISGMTKAALAFLATPLGMILGALALALKAVWEYLNHTVDGQEKLAKITGYVSGVFNQLKDIVLKVGRAIYQAVTDPKKAIVDFGKFMWDNIVTRVKAMGGVFKSFSEIVSNAMKFKFDKAKDAFKDLMKNAVDSFTGIKDSAGKLANKITDINEKAKETAAIEAEAFRLKKERSEWEIKANELQAKEAELMGKMRNSSLSAAAREKLAGQRAAIVNERFDGEKKLLEKEIELQNRRMAITENETEVEEKLNKLKAQNAALDARRASALATQERMSGTLSNKMESEANKAEQKRQLIEQIENELKSFQMKNEADEIQMLKEGTQKKLAVIENAYSQQMQTISAQRLKWEKENRKAGLGSELSEKQSEALNKATAIAEQQRRKAIMDTYQEEFNAMGENISQYGSFLEKKLAITKLYADKISKTTGVEKENLERERDSQLTRINNDSLKNKVNWAVVFGEFGNMFQDIIRPVLKDTKEFTKTDEFKGYQTEDKKTVYDAIRQMEQAVLEVTPVSFSELQEQIDSYVATMGKLEKAQKDVVTAHQQLCNAEAVYKDAMANGTALQQTVAKSMYDAANTHYNATVKTAKGLQEEGENLKTTITSTATQLQTNIENVSNGLKGLSSGSLSGIFSGLKQLSSGLASMKELPEGVTSAFGKLAKGMDSVPILGAVFGILDVLKDGISNLLSSIIDTVFSAVTNIIGDVLSGDLFVSLFNSIKDGLTGLFDAFTFGGFSSWTSSSNAKMVAETTERLTKQNEGLQVSIDKLKSSIDKSYGGKAIKSYQEASENQKKKVENLRVILDTQQGYHSAHHSNDYYWNMSADSTEAVNRLLGTRLRRNEWDDWSKLTAEQMDKIRTWLPDIWSEMLKQGKYDKSEFFEQYADEAGKLEELTEKIRENLLGTSFDGLRDSFIDSLMDMSLAAEDFTDQFSEMMQRALLQSAISNKFENNIRKWYESITDAMQGANGTYKELSPAQIESYREQWDEMVRNMMEERDRIAAITGFDSAESSREASQKGIATASQDSVDELNGRATAIQGHTYSISENTKLLVETTSAILKSVMNIEEDTASMDSRMESMESDMRSIRDSLDDIHTKGIRLRG